MLPHMGRNGRLAMAGALLALLLLCLASTAGAQPVELAAPYEYMGWGDPQPPAEVLAATGVQDLTLAFILSKGRCNPEWDGQRPLLGGVDQDAIESIRGAGGEVSVSFGGWSGKKLGSACSTPAALAAAYEKVIAAYSLNAIDVDIEHGEFTNAKTRRRVVEALAAVQQAHPGVEISITMGTSETGPEKDGVSLISDAAAIGFQPNAWTIMPFDFGRPATDMGHASIRAAEGLAADLVSAYHVSSAYAYEHAGISSMNGHTDESSEVVTLEDFQTILTFAQAHDLARLTFWSVNRDRPCKSGGAAEEECSGIEQQALAFTRMVASYH